MGTILKAAYYDYQDKMEYLMETCHADGILAEGGNTALTAACHYEKLLVSMYLLHDISDLTLMLLTDKVTSPCTWLCGVEELTIHNYTGLATEKMELRCLTCCMCDIIQ